MFTDKVELKDFEKQDPEYQDLIRRVLAIQADCEIGGPNLYVKHILPTAPTKLDQLIVARTAAEEMDHFRKMARLAGDIGVDVSYTLSRPNQERYVEAFRGEIKTWEDYAVFGFLVDRVGRFQLEEFLDCTYLPLARVVEDPDIIREEEGHVDFGTNAAPNSPPKAESIRKEFKKRWTTGTSKGSTCSATASRTVPSATCTGGSNAGPMRWRASSTKTRSTR